MKFTQLVSKTQRSVSEDEVSLNAQLLERAGFIDKLAAGIYTYLPLGLRTLRKIQQIVREEMDALGAQEFLMPALQPAEPWKKTGRWDDPGKEVMFQFEGHGDKAYTLGWTHEEIVTPLMGKFIASYQDLPLAVYQIQDKFRNEPRAKSGLLRGREFSMKDLYSFHRDTADLERFYEQVSDAYLKIFNRVGLDALVVEASGGAFSKYSHEFQVLTEYGEDHILYCEACRYAQNREIAEIKTGGHCLKCQGQITEGKAIEVGNIFQLGTRFSDAFGLKYTDKHGGRQPIYMGCYGIGPSRVMGAIVEIHHDEKGIIWPESVAPFQVHLIAIIDQKSLIRNEAEKVYRKMVQVGIEVLYDDRDISAGEKFADADLIGLPIRLIISEKTLKGKQAEWKERASDKIRMVKLSELTK